MAINQCLKHAIFIYLDVCIYNVICQSITKILCNELPCCWT